MKFVLLLGVDESLFKACFGKSEEWTCAFQTLSDQCKESELKDALADPDLLCCVVQDFEAHWKIVCNYYNKGGFVVYFGIYGEFGAPRHLSSAFGLDWSFSAYTKHEYEVTSIGQHYIGDDIVKVQYSKANLLKVPAEDRILTAKKPKDIREYILEIVGIQLEEGDDLENLPDPDDRKIYERAKNGGFAKWCEEMDSQSPLVMHLGPNGAKIAYLGFVNGDGEIPRIVRALLTGEKAKQ